MSDATVNNIAVSEKHPLVAAVEPVGEFFVQSQQLINKCTKPDRKEFKKIALATLIGFLVMGLIGFFIKLAFIPINQMFLA